jgi:hypothetical protein
MPRRRQCRTVVRRSHGVQSTSNPTIVKNHVTPMIAINKVMP